MFRLRQIQSEWYTVLFQSGREPWNDAYSYIWKKYREMSAWFNDLSPSLAPATRAFFGLEILFSYVYILSPNPRCPRMSPYAQKLLIEHCIAYATRAHETLSDQSQSIRSIFTFYDAIRTYMTGRQFVDVLARNIDILLQPNVVPPPTQVSPAVDFDTPVDPLGASNDNQPPPIPQPVDIDPNNLSMLAPESVLPQQALRAINAINKFTTILSHLGIRFGYIVWRDRFQQESGPLVAQLQLRMKQQEADQSSIPFNPNQVNQLQPNRTPPSYPVNPYASTPSYAHQQQQQQQQQPNPMFGATPSRPPMPNEWSQLQPQQERTTSSAFSSGMQASMPVPQPSIPMAPAQLMDLGPGTTAAWETLPGGSLNARFS